MNQATTADELTADISSLAEDLTYYTTCDHQQAITNIAALERKLAILRRELQQNPN